MQLHELTVGALLQNVAAKSPVPGGGAVAGVVGALAASLGGMVVSFSLGKKSLADQQPMLAEAASRLEALRAECLRLGDADAAAYERLNALQKLPPDDPQRGIQYGEAVAAAIDVPMRLATVCADLMGALRGLAGASNPHLKSDLAIAGSLCLAGAEAARWNVAINLREVGEEARRAAMRERVDGVVAACAAMKGEIDRMCG